MKVSQEILNLVPYKPGKPMAETQREYGLAKVTKLASNENPLGPSPLAVQALQKALLNQHRYPDPSGFELIQKIAEKWQVSPSRLAIGNGSDEIIDILIRIYCEAGDSILTSQSAFSAYEVSAGAARVNTRRVPLRSDYKIDLEAMAEYFFKNVEAEKIRLIFIPNPNNPTGAYNTKSEVDAFLKKLAHVEDVLIIFDEAYNEFVRAQDYESVLHQTVLFQNLILIKTFSKSYGLAGLRLGALVAPPQTIDLYNRVRKPFNVNDLAQTAALAALDDQDFIARTQKVTWDGLDYFYRELSDLGLPFIPSQGNFVMFDTRRDALRVYEALLREGIILRPVLNYGFKYHLRMSVGTMEENQLALAALRKVLPEISLAPELKSKSESAVDPSVEVKRGLV